MNSNLHTKGLSRRPRCVNYEYETTIDFNHEKIYTFYITSKKKNTVLYTHRQHILRTIFFSPLLCIEYPAPTFNIFSPLLHIINTASNFFSSLFLFMSFSKPNHQCHSRCVLEMIGAPSICQCVLVSQAEALSNFCHAFRCCRSATRK